MVFHSSEGGVIINNITVTTLVMTKTVTSYCWETKRRQPTGGNK